MKYLNIIFTVLFFISPQAHSAEAEGPIPGKEVNGGAGIFKNGIPMTFYSAKVWARPEALNISEIPGLKKLTKEVIPTLGFSKVNTGILLTALTPSENRQYLNVQSINKTQEESIKKIYSDLTGIPVEDVVILLLTEPATKRTFILPEFYRLSENEQMAYLMHEAYWIMHPKAKYEDVAKAEWIFQDYLTNPTIERQMKVLGIFGGPASKVKLALDHDIKEGILNKIFGKDQISLQDILGDEFFKCWEENGATNTEALTGRCRQILKNHYFINKQAFDGSLLIQLIFTPILNDQVFFDFKYESYNAIHPNIFLLMRGMRLETEFNENLQAVSMFYTVTNNLAYQIYNAQIRWSEIENKTRVEFVGYAMGPIVRKSQETPEEAAHRKQVDLYKTLLR